MEQHFFEYTLLALWSLAVGAFLCAIYDIFRISRLGNPQNTILLFFLDILFSLICAFSMLLLFFNLSYGKMRLYAFVFALVGFLVWRFTFSRIYISIIKRIIAIFKIAIGYVKQKLFSALFAIYRYILTSFYCRTTIRDFTKGNYFKQRKEVKNVTKEDGKDQLGH